MKQRAVFNSASDKERSVFDYAKSNKITWSIPEDSTDITWSTISGTIDLPVMARPRWSEWVKRISLDGFEFEVLPYIWLADLGYTGPGVMARMLVPKEKYRGPEHLLKRFAKDDKLQVGVMKPLRGIDTEEKFFRLCMFAACEIVAHEAQEQFEVDGAQFYDPHSGGDIYSLLPKDAEFESMTATTERLRQAARLRGELV